jgi:putative transcriptional regulator
MKYKCRLRVILAEREIQHGVFAKKIEMSESAFSAIVNGHSLPKFDTLYKISDELDMDFREIWIVKSER